MNRDTRAVSIAITHGLTIGITAVLLSGLLVGTGNLLQAQEERVAQEQFDEIGGDLVGQINSLDRLNETGEDVTVSVQPSYPERVAGHGWSLELADGEHSPFDTEYVLNISSYHHDRVVQYPLNTTTGIETGGAANSHSPVVSLCDGERIQFGECE